MARFDIAFEGGGAKGIALSGAVSTLEDQGHTLGRLVGTSAGAITASNLAVGYTGRDILAGSTAKTPSGDSVYSTFTDTPRDFTDEELLNSGLAHLMSDLKLPFIPERTADRIEEAILRGLMHLPGFRNLFSFVELGGLYAGDAFLEWMRACLDADGRGLADATFAQVFEHTGVDLTVIASDTSAQEVLALNHRTAPDCPVAWGVRMSMSIPFYWQEVPWQKAWGTYLGEDIAGHIVVDGGVISNFPLQFLVDTDVDVTHLMGPHPRDGATPLGLMLDAAQPVPNDPERESDAPAKKSGKLVSRVTRILNTMLDASDNLEISTHADSVCRLPVKGYGTTEFNLSTARVEALFNGARGTMADWLKAHDL